MSCIDTAPAKSPTRSRIGNGSLPAGIDGRSAEARRFKELLAAFVQEFGGASVVTESELSDLRRAAWLTIRGEQLQGAIANGEPVDDDALVRNANAISRALAALRRRHKPKGRQPGLHAYLAGRPGAGQ